ncbi:MAG: MFS transporter [Nitrososphaeria archaeon]
MNKIIIFNSVIGTFYSINNVAITPLLSLFALTYLNATKEELGYIMSAFFIASVVSKLIIGFLIKQRYLFTLQAFSLLLMILSPILYVFSGNVLGFALVRIIHGFGFAVIFLSCLTIATILIGERNDFSISVLMTFAAIGMTLAPLLSTIFTFYFDISTTFLLISIITCLSLPFSLYLTSKKSLLFDKASKKLSLKEITNSFFKEKWFKSSFLAYFAYALIYGAITTYIPPYARQSFGFADYQITAMFFGLFIFTIFTRIILIKRNEKSFLKQILLSSLIFTISLLVLLGIIKDPILFAFTFVLIGIGHGFIYPIAAILVSNSSPPEHRLEANTLFLISFDLGNVIGPMVASLMVSFMPINHVLIGSAVLPTIIWVLVVKSINSI